MAAIGVVFGGPSPEHDISILTGLQAARTLSEAAASLVCLYWTKAGRWLRVPHTVEASDFLEPEPPGSVPVELAVPGGFVEKKRMRGGALDIDVVLNCCHGGPGEDGNLSALLRMAGMKVSGPTPQTSALMMDKVATAAVAALVGVPTIETVVVADDGPTGAGLPPAPWVVKPRFGGSSIGVEAGVGDLATVRALAHQGASRSGAVLQPYLEGWTDLNVAVRTFPEVECSPIERPLRSGEKIYDYAGKYLSGGGRGGGSGGGMDSAPRELPAQVPDEISERLLAHARTLVAPLGITGAPRIDFLWDGGDRLVLCEVNAIPGAWGAYLWQAGGVSRRALYEDLLAEAVAGPVMPYQWSASSDGRALRAAGAIASKLG